MTAPAGQRRSMPVPEGLVGLRLDAVLVRLFGLSRSRAASIVRSGDALVDGAAVGKGDRVTCGAWLEVTLPVEPAAARPTAVPGLTVIHQDDDIVVVDKPVGVAAHPSPGWTGPTVTAGLAAAGVVLASSGAAERAGVVHRLDAGTTGLMVLAKSEHAYRVLKQAFRDRTVDKRYRALAQGHPDPTEGTIDAPIDRDPAHDWRFAVIAGGRESVTHYRTIEAVRAATLLDVGLETGRTHQIRVHLAAVRHPLVGDTMYGADPTLAARLHLSRQWLHAAQLAFRHPRDDRRVTFTSPDPADLAAALGVLRSES